MTMRMGHWVLVLLAIAAGYWLGIKYPAMGSRVGM